MADLDRQKQRIEKVLGDANKRVVIFMDDLDRLDRDEIQVIFRLVKVAADFENTAYVLAFDDQVVAAALAERYATGTIHGTNFLEKIVQLPLHLPPVDLEVLRSITLEAVGAALEQLGEPLSEKDVHRFLNVFERGVRPQLTTPRMSKRYGNALTFALPMIADEVNVVDLLLVEAMRIFYPRLYEWVRGNPGSVLTTMSKEDAVLVKTAFEDSTNHLRTEQQAAAQVLVTELFPRIETAWQNKTWGNDWDQVWTRARRVASRAYFERYFTYSVGVNDISDREVARFIELLGTSGATEEATGLVQQLAASNAERLLSKLRDRIEDMDHAQRADLVVELVALGPALSPSTGGFMSSPQALAGRTIAKVIDTLPADQKGELATAAVQGAVPMSFAFEVFMSLRVMFDADSLSEGGDQSESDQTRELGRLLGARVQEAWSAEEIDLLQFGRYMMSGLHVWAHYAASTDFVRSALLQRTLSEPAIYRAALRASLPTAWQFETGMPLDGRIDREEYNQLVQYFDAASVIAALKAEYGSDLGEGEYYAHEDAPLDKRIAHQFVNIHTVAEREQAGTQDSASGRPGGSAEVDDDANGGTPGPQE